MKDFGNTRKAAKRIRLRSSPKVLRNTIGERDNGKRDRVDFIRFSLTEQSQLKGRIRGLPRRRRVLLLDSDGTVIKRFNHVGRRQTLNLLLESGDYFIKIRSGRRQRLRKYRLKLSADTQPRRDLPIPESGPIDTPPMVSESGPIDTSPTVSESGPIDTPPMVSGSEPIDTPPTVSEPDLTDTSPTDMSPKNPSPSDETEIVNKSGIIGGSVKIGPEDIPTTPTSIRVLSNLPEDKILEVGRDKIEGLELFILEEKKNITLTDNLNIYSGYNFTNVTPDADVSLLAGDQVSSYMIWVDPEGQGAIGGDGSRYNWVGFIEFDAPILGIIPRNIRIETTVNATNKIFGLDNVDYSSNTQSLDNVYDIVTIDGNILNIQLSAGDGTDHFRVITAAVPRVSQSSISYADATNGIIANLDTERVLLPIFGTQEFPAIMTLGDSNTAGFGSGNDGSYRIQLYERFTQDDLTINFVGSQEDAAGLVPDTDTDNEGHSGFTISNLAGLFLRPFRPGALEENPADIVLLMAGTNDANREDLSLGVTAVVDQMIADMNELLERIQSESPNTKILLSSLPPSDTFDDDGTRAQRVQEFNSRLPGFVQEQVALGRNVTFVDAGGSLTEEVLFDGVHPDAEGLTQLGNAWYEALVQEEQLSGISNLTGSEFDDRITGSGGANILDGGAGNDWLSGTTAVLAGANEQDVLTGGAGSDRFILGDSSQAYYTTNGDNDYVRIQDFDANVDVVQLHGTANNYAHGQVGSDRHLRLTGTNELIAIFSNTSNLNLSTRGFTFA